MYHVSTFFWAFPAEEYAPAQGQQYAGLETPMVEIIHD
jgi:hypothetical protein